VAAGVRSGPARERGKGWCCCRSAPTDTYNTPTHPPCACRAAPYTMTQTRCWRPALTSKPSSGEAPRVRAVRGVRHTRHARARSCSCYRCCCCPDNSGSAPEWSPHGNVHAVRPPDVFGAYGARGALACARSYPLPPPGGANLSTASKANAQRYRTLSLVLEQPFKDNEGVRCCVARVCCVCVCVGVGGRAARKAQGASPVLPCALPTHPPAPSTAKHTHTHTHSHAQRRHRVEP
jgi:hypothetical protein